MLIIGLLSIFIFLFQVESTHAFYSPVLSNEANLIRRHITQSKQKTGVGTFYDVGLKLSQNQQQPSSIFNIFSNAVAETLFNGGLQNSVSDVFLLFRYWTVNEAPITTCLRDDIWEIQILQEQVLNELFKAALLGNGQDANLLWADYQLLAKRIQGGEITRNGKTENLPGLKDTYKQPYWFPNSQQFYINCPYGEYERAWQALSQSFDRFVATFGNAGSQSLGSFSIQSINSAARQRAIFRAQQWIRQNQLRLSIGGVDGGSQRSLIQGPGIKGLLGDLRTEWTFVSKLTSEIFNSTLNSLIPNKRSNVNDYVVAYEQAQDAKKLATQQIEKALTYRLSLQNVSEESIAQMERILITTNTTIKAGFDKSISKEGNIGGVCELLGYVVKNQCKNKSSGIDIVCNR